MNGEEAIGNHNTAPGLFISQPAAVATLTKIIPKQRPVFVAGQNFGCLGITGGDRGREPDEQQQRPYPFHAPFLL